MQASAQMSESENLRVIWQKTFEQLEVRVKVLEQQFCEEKAAKEKAAKEKAEAEKEPEDPVALLLSEDFFLCGLPVKVTYW